MQSNYENVLVFGGRRGLLLDTHDIGEGKGSASKV